MTDAESHISIEPATKGRFEQHERTVVFVPDRPLKPATIYTVTVSRGVSVGATGEASDVETRFRFETAATTGPAPCGRVRVAGRRRRVAGRRSAGARDVVHRRRRRRQPASEDAGRGLSPGRLTGRDRRVPDDPGPTGLGELVDRRHRRHDGPDRAWSARSCGSSRTRATSSSACPRRLDAGWYLVQLPDKTHPSQAVLQVTDVAGYLAISETRTARLGERPCVGRPGPRARPPRVGATTIGTTDRGRTHPGHDAGGAPAGREPGLYAAMRCGRGGPGDRTVALVFLPAAIGSRQVRSLRRLLLRVGWRPVVLGPAPLGPRPLSPHGHDQRVGRRPRPRRRDGADGGHGPPRRRSRTTSTSDRRPRRVHATPADTGAFTASIALAGVAEGSYSLELVVDGSILRTAYLDVGPIVQAGLPARDRDRPAGLHRRRSDPGRTSRHPSSRARPSRACRCGSRASSSARSRTDACGQAIHRTTAGVEPRQEGPGSTPIDVSPARAEEGEIAGASREFVVFPSSRTIASDGCHQRRSGPSDVATSTSSTWSGSRPTSPAGRPSGTSIRAARPSAALPSRSASSNRSRSRTRTGTEYDFIEKRVVPDL